MKLAPAVDAHIKNVPGVKLKINPGTAIGNHPRGIEQLPASMSLSLVVFEEDSRGTVELANDNPFGSVDHERAVLGHQGNLTEIDFLFFHVFDAGPRSVRRRPTTQVALLLSKAQQKSSLVDGIPLRRI